MDATSTLQFLRSGETTIDKIVNDSIAKIETTHTQLNAATEILKEEAKRQLQNLADGPLKGLPISIKECYAMEGKLITSGSKRMKPIVCREDAAVVAKLKRAGAVIVARGNTSEFLLGRETGNLVCGTTNNSINPSLTTGGSSGGDGSLVGSSCVEFGIGTDIGGSCRYPAVFNGIVGFKPASGQIDKTGIFPVAGNEFIETMNSPGILCRSVRDARLVYNVIGNKQLAINKDISHVQLYTSSNFKVEIKDGSISNALQASVDFLKRNTASVTDIDIPESGSLFIDFTKFIPTGFTDKIYEWSVTESGKTLSYFGELFRRIRGGKTLSDEIFALLPAFNLYKQSASNLNKIIENVKTLQTKYHSLLGQNGILILPTIGLLAPPHKKFYPQYNKPGVVKTITPVSFCNVLNLSCITIPAWKFQKNKNTNPPAIQLIAAADNEELLLNTAEFLETALAN